jgi:predicted dehydrogenase
VAAVKTLRAGVIGLGVGEQHVAGYLAHPACEVAAVCDLDEEKLAAQRARDPLVRTTRDADELLADPEIDVVSVASYDDVHYKHVRKALEAGKHVFVEKPLCHHTEEAVELHRLLSERPELRLSSNLVLRASPRFRELKERIARGGLGELYYVEADYDYGRLHKLTQGWRGDLEFYSVVYGGAVHVVDLLLWLTGDRVVEVSARGNRIASRDSKFRFNDLVVATLEFESGLLGKVTANFGCVMPHFHALQVFGTGATFVNGLDRATLYTRDGAETIETAYPGVTKDALVHGFVDAILDGGQPPVTADEVFAGMAVCFAIEASVRERSAVAVHGLG